ncbi:hypothetical protein C8F04DRAFT_1336265 [Mycena alexandri]|uniref:Uncharacterized protein n=1 Tax=Mycena alexandri TaxID=1745969 RepID=A0AAD6SZN8_9AGAR|nr:hypothetical protein C8F04DRAFT_1336265 [Mycena alexandri]
MANKDGKRKAAPKPKASTQPKRAPAVKTKTVCKKKKKVAEESSEDSADDEEESEEGVLSINWKADPGLSVKMLALISESTEIKQSLYPPPGPNASSTKGGGQPKTVAHWDLCVLLLGDDPKYKDSIEATANNPKAKLAYGNKMKNRLSTMAKTCRRHNAMMGETGAGIRDASQIDMSKSSAFTTKWAQIAAKCPWYFEMRNLIGQRPNLVPTGLGHSGSALAAGVIIPTPNAPPAASTNDGETGAQCLGLKCEMIWDPTD